MEAETPAARKPRVSREERADKRRVADEAKAETKRLKLEAKESARKAKEEAALLWAEEYERNKVERAYDFPAAGISHEGRADRVSAKCFPGCEITLARDRENPYDRNAVRLLTLSGYETGFVPKYLAIQIGPALDDGMLYMANCKKLIGGKIGAIPIIQLQMYKKTATLPGLRTADSWTAPTEDGRPYHIVKQNDSSSPMPAVVLVIVLFIIACALVATLNKP